VSRWQPYPTYKDSNIEWLGLIPVQWKITRLRFACEINPHKSEIAQAAPDTEVSFLPMENLGEDGTFRLDETRHLDQVWQGYTYFRDADVLVAKITPCFENGKGAMLMGLRNGIGFGTTELHVLRAKEGIDPSFVFYLTRSHPFRQLGAARMYGAAGQQRVPEQYVQDFGIGVPALEEQRAIAAFLDRETATIDALIAEQRRLIELLQERRMAIISHAVTKGLDPDVPMKDSGIPAIGLVPAHWEVRRNKRIFEEVYERSVTGDEELLSVSHITGVTPRSEKQVYMFLAESFEGYKICRPGDLVINTMWAWMGALGITSYNGIVSPSYNVYRLRTEQRDNYYPQYLDFFYRIPAHVSEINRHSKGIWSSRLRLYPDSFFEMYTPSPPFEEQRAIAEHVLEQTTKSDNMVAPIETHIAQLEEYRTALVAAAVTGKIDVRRQALAADAS
jgi:type I restriction enzyme S subunit